MNSKLWSTTSPEALGSISAYQSSPDWNSLLNTYMKAKACDRPSLLDSFAAVAIRVTPDRIEVLWLPRKTIFGRKFYLVGFADNSIATRRVVAYEIDDSLFADVVCVFKSRPSCTIFPKGQKNLVQYLNERAACINDAGSSPEQKEAYAGEPPAGHFQNDQPELRHLHIVPRMLPIPFGYDGFMGGKYSLLRDIFEAHEASLFWFRGTHLGDPEERSYPNYLLPDRDPDFVTFHYSFKPSDQDYLVDNVKPFQFSAPSKDIKFCALLPESHASRVDYVKEKIFKDLLLRAELNIATHRSKFPDLYQAPPRLNKCQSPQLELPRHAALTRPMTRLLLRP